jgi:hypothetical protein
MRQVSSKGRRKEEGGKRKEERGRRKGFCLLLSS